ncbi:MAG: PP2C family protein-serine/threonine phosphatase [Phycisphaerales bacterium]
MNTSLTSPPRPDPAHANPAPPEATPAEQARADAGDAGEHVMQCMEIWGGNEAIDAKVDMPGLRAWVYSKPYKGESAGGDIHYVSSCATGRITRLLVADVSGHGTKVADLAVKLRDLMRRYVNYLDQSAFVRQLNREFAQVASLGKFATAIVATYFSSSDCLVASNAGHPRPLWFQSRTRRWSILKDKPREGDTREEPSNLPFGIDDISGYDQLKVHLAPGDLLVIYTDSLMEAQNSRGELLGEEGLLRLAETLDPGDPRRFMSDLIDRVIAFAGGEVPGDDITLMALAASGRKPRPSLGAQAGAVWEFILALANSWRAGAPPVPWPDWNRANLLGAFSERFGRSWNG